MKTITPEKLVEQISSSKLVALLGPTATGKTDLAFKLASQLPFDLISLDSRQVYRYTDIVSGKDIPETFGFTDRGCLSFFSSPAGFRLYGLSLVEPSARFSLHELIRYLPLWMAEIEDRHRGVILVGGTIHWFYRLLSGHYEAVFTPEDKEWRRQAAKMSLEEVQERLLHLNEKAKELMTRSDWFNRRRLIRWYERLAANPLPEKEKGKIDKLLQVKKKVLLLDRPDEELFLRLRRRIEARLEAGAIEETKKLVKNYGQKIIPLESPGYRQILLFLQGKLNLTEMKEEWFRAEVSLIQKQRRWIKKMAEMIEFKVEANVPEDRKS